MIEVTHRLPYWCLKLCKNIFPKLCDKWKGFWECLSGKQTKITADEVLSLKAKLRTQQDKLQKYEDLLPAIKDIAKIDHDINTPLCVILLTMDRVLQAAEQYNDPDLQKGYNDIAEAVKNISAILVRIQAIKRID